MTICYRVFLNISCPNLKSTNFSEGPWLLSVGNVVGDWGTGAKELFASVSVICSKPFQWTKSENICKRNTSGVHTDISNSSLGLQVFI